MFLQAHHKLASSSIFCYRYKDPRLSNIEPEKKKKKKITVAFYNEGVAVNQSFMCEVVGTENSETH